MLFFLVVIILCFEHGIAILVTVSAQAIGIGGAKEVVGPCLGWTILENASPLVSSSFLVQPKTFYFALIKLSFWTVLCWPHFYL